MDITRFAIEKKRITSMVLLLIAVAGLMAYSSMPRAEDPGFIVRTALIITNFPGASPERVELLVTEKLEKAIQQMPEVDDIVSESKPGKSIIYVNVKESYREMRPIWDSLRRKVDDAKSELPSGVVGPFVNDEFGDVFGTLIALTGEGYSYAELKDIADDIRNELLLIDQVAKVDIFGAQEERVFVEFNNAQLAEVGISPGQLQQILESRNIIFPGGEIFTDDEQIVLEPSGNFESVEELKKTVIKLPGQKDLVFLESIANIDRGYIDPPRTKVRYGGLPALMVAVSLREGGNISVLGEEVLQQVRRFKETYPIGVDFDIVYLQSAFVNKKVDDFVSNLLQAVVIVMGTMLVFLGLRTGLVVSSLIPMAMVMALLVMSFFDIGLDQMSLASLIIALGMLVDNAIVMSESIMVQMSEGKGAVQAAIDSAKELRISLLTSSLTTAAAFLPIFLAESAVGEYTAPLFKVVTITLLCSWLLSLTMTPLLCVLFLKVKKAEEGFHTKFYQTYRGLLLTGLRRPWLTLASIIVVFFAVMQLFRFIPQIFFPANDKAVMEMGLTMPVGTPLEKTDEVVAQLDEFIQREMKAQFDEKGNVVKHGIVSWTSFIGSGAPKYALGYNPEPSTPEYAYILLSTTDRWKIDEQFIPQLEAFCRQAFPDLNADLGPLDMGPPVEAPIQVRVSGKDIDQVFAYANQVKAHLENEVAGAKNVRDDWGLRTKKLFVRINQPRAQRAGLTSQDIAVSLQTVLSGIQTTDYREEDEVIPVLLRSVAADRKDIGKLETHNIYVQLTGQAVPLKQVADVEVQFQPAKVLRRNRLKTVIISADLEPGFNAISSANQIDSWLAGEKASWPIGYKYEIGGELESSGDANESINAKLPIAGLLIVLLLVWQFDSIRRPTIILLTIPLGLIGVAIGLFVTGQPFGFMALLGVISLAGIVINNAIVLLDRIKLEIEVNGLEPARAVIESAQRRLRPILLTTATTMGGLIPLWLGGGPLFEAMAVAILFGLMFATVLTLGVVPVLYSLFFKVKFKHFVY